MKISIAEENSSGSRRRKLLLAAGLFILTCIVYGYTYQFSFVNFDDDVHVYNNPFVANGLSTENLQWAFGIHGPSQWHPLAWVSHQIDCELFGLWAGAHHLTNFAFHVGSVLTLFGILTSMTGAIWRSAFVAAIFAVHPLNVESVAWISERRNVLSMLFGLLTIACYSSYVLRGGAIRYLCVCLLFAMGLMAKPLMVTLPCVLLLLDYWPLSRLGGESRCSLRFLLIEKLPLFALSGISCYLTILCQQSAGVVATTSGLPISVRVANAIAAYGIYLRRIFFPTDLAAFYPHPGFADADPLSVLLWPCILSGITLLAITIWCIVRVRQCPVYAIGWFWYLGTFVPMIGLLQVGRQQMADRYAYLPMIGILIAMTWLLGEWAAKSRWARRAIAGGGLLAILFCAALSWHQVRYWRDSISLFQRAVDVTESNSWAHNNLGLALHEAGQSTTAVRHLAEALRIDPNYGLAYYNLGIVLHDIGQRERAISRFRTAIQLLPHHVDAHIRLGAALGEVGQLNAASSVFRHAIVLSPENATAHLNLGLVLGRQGDIPLAIRHLRMALEQEPDNVTVNCALASVLLATGDLDEAAKLYKHALRLMPECAPAHRGLGAIAKERGLE